MGLILVRLQGESAGLQQRAAVAGQRAHGGQPRQAGEIVFPADVRSHPVVLVEHCLIALGQGRGGLRHGRSMRGAEANHQIDRTPLAGVQVRELAHHGHVPTAPVRPCVLPVHAAVAEIGPAVGLAHKARRDLHEGHAALQAQIPIMAFAGVEVAVRDVRHVIIAGVLHVRIDQHVGRNAIRVGGDHHPHKQALPVGVREYVLLDGVLPLLVRVHHPIGKGERPARGVRVQVAHLAVGVHALLVHEAGTRHQKLEILDLRLVDEPPGSLRDNALGDGEPDLRDGPGGGGVVEGSIDVRLVGGSHARLAGVGPDRSVTAFVAVGTARGGADNRWNQEAKRDKREAENASPSVHVLSSLSIAVGSPSLHRRWASQPALCYCNGAAAVSPCAATLASTDSRRSAPAPGSGHPST